MEFLKQFKDVIEWIVKLVPIWAFLWYRSGRLWAFYFNLRNQAAEQFDKHSIDRPAWDKLLNDEAMKLSQATFGSTLRIEVEYLMDRLPDLRDHLWRAGQESGYEHYKDDSGSPRYQSRSFRVLDRKNYAHYVLRQELAPLFRFCGARLLFNSLRSQKRLKAEEEDSFSGVVLDVPADPPD